MLDSRPVSFRDLTRLLERCGFTPTRVKGSHRLFTHPETETTVMLPDDSSTRPAMPVQVAAVRKILDERGVLPREEFNQRVQENGRTTTATNGRHRGRTSKAAGVK